MTSGLSKGYAFAEYLDGTITDQAIAGLNGIHEYFFLFLQRYIFRHAIGRQEVDRAEGQRGCQEHGRDEHGASKYPDPWHVWDEWSRAAY